MGLSVLRMADGLVNLVDEVNLKGGVTLGKKGFWFGGRGHREP